MSFPRYAAYKDSGVEWLGEVPEHWDITKVKHVFKIGRGRVIAQDILQENGLYPVFSSQTKDNGCLGYIDTYDFDCDQITWTTDGANAGTVFIRGGKHNCTNVCGTLELKTLTNNLFYYGYYLQFATQFYKRPDTNGAKIMNNEMADILLFKISISEQTTIAAFLDCETAKIDNLINEQKKLIELLKEKRQAVISTAVTKGLNPHAPMKDSGVEWLGEVPEHWEVVPIKWYSSCKSGDSITSTNTEQAIDELNFIPAIGGNGIMGFTSKSNIDTPVIVVGRVGALCGNVHKINPPAWVSDNALILNISASFSIHYLCLALRSRNLNDIASRTAQPLITGTQVTEQRIPLPPINEQTTIITFLDQETAKIDNLIQQAQKATTLLQERRTALISAAVTGKIDVRGFVTTNTTANCVGK